MRLWLRLTLAMAALAVVPVMVVGWLAIDAATEGAMVRPEEELNRESASIATFVGAWADAERAQLGGWYRVWNLDDADADYQTGLLRAIYTAVDGVVVVGLVDEHLRPIVSSQWLEGGDAPSGREPGSAAREAALLAHLPTGLDGEVTFGRPYRAPGAVAPSLPVVVTRVGSRDRLIAEISLSTIARVFPADDARAAGLFAGPGAAVVGDHPLLREPQIADVVALGLDLVFSPTDTSGRLRGAATVVPGTGWLVVVAEPAARAARVVADIRFQTALVVAMALAAVGAMGVLLHQQITVPVLRLRQAVGRIAGGGYDERVLLRRADELGELAEDLNFMAERLARSREEIGAQQEEIRRFNEDLQQRVEARTADLRAAQSRLVVASQVAAISEVGSGLAHELNNPLAAILGLAQVAGSRGGADAAVFERIERQAQRCRDVVETMVRFSSGDLDPSRAPTIDLARVVRAAMESAAPAFAQRGIALHEALPAAPVVARLEPALAAEIARRWLELCRVGLSAGSSLRVRVSGSADGAAIELLPSEPLNADGASDDWRASGVQLWVARRLIDQTGGRIFEPDGERAAWTLSLPGAG